MIEEFVNFCRNNLDLNSAHYAHPYKSLSVCILDCVYSLQARYFSTTVPPVLKNPKSNYRFRFFYIEF